MRIAYQGAPGAFSQQAALQVDPHARTLGMPDFATALAAVANGRADRAVIPVENAIAGPVEAAQAALAQRPDLEIVGELRLPIRLALMALPGATLADVRWAESHPVALAQCTRWLSAHRLEPRPAYDTAGAARSIAEDRDWTRAAVAPREAAERYGLQILADDIADAAGNVTRFVVVARRVATQEAAA
jgi:prephenate dehydratase